MKYLLGIVQVVRLSAVVQAQFYTAFQTTSTLKELVSCDFANLRDEDLLSEYSTTRVA